MSDEYCFFIRHGETEWNCERRTMGWTDIPLNETGKQQAFSAQRLVKDLGIQTICTSPLQRAHQTAEILNQVLEVPLIELENLKEAGWGEDEGQVRVSAGLQMLEESRLGRRAENAESYESFEQRVVRGLKEALTYPAPVLIVGHGGIFWSLATYFKWPTNKTLANCQLLQIYFPNVYGDWLIREVS